MSHKLIGVNGHLALNIYYEVEGAPEQKRWNSVDTWTVTTVHFSLNTDKRFGPMFPRVHDLTTEDILGEHSPISGVVVHGVKNKRKDGQPGKVPISVHYYTRSTLPDWLQAIAHEVLTGLARR